jgi:hypothetical protein
MSSYTEEILCAALSDEVESRAGGGRGCSIKGEILLVKQELSDEVFKVFLLDVTTELPE